MSEFADKVKGLGFIGPNRSREVRERRDADGHRVKITRETTDNTVATTTERRGDRVDLDLSIKGTRTSTRVAGRPGG